MLAINCIKLSTLEEFDPCSWPVNLGLRICCCDNYSKNPFFSGFNCFFRF
ncbi:hypothetical protein Sjap_019924 [Stephania japonica]|uniref:Uncharacterized protein n=1 Tax=Stephania japonica TaxID=461633 RepID=A0AAP0EZP5_9MAGN